MGRSTNLNFSSKRIQLTVSDSAYRRFKTYARKRGTGLSETCDRLFTILDPSKLPYRPAQIKADPYGREPILPASAVRAVRERVESGEAYRKIAADLGVSLATIQRAYHGKGRNGYAQKKFQGPTPLPPALCKEIRDKHESGLSYGAIERFYLGQRQRISKTTVSRVINRQGAYAFR
jgi:hypothetical protein